MTPPELRLALALARVRAQRGSALELLPGADLDALAAALHRRRVLPLLGTRLIELAGAESLPGHFVEAVERARREHRAAALARLARLEVVLAALREHGIAAASLKGPLLAERVHGDVGLRSPGDLDMLVAPGDLHAASEVLQGLGHLPPADPLDARGLPRLHLALGHATEPAVELHWRVHWYEEEFSARLLDPDPVDDLAALLLFYARDGFHGVRLLADITAWWDRHGGGPGLLAGHAAAHPRLARAWRAAARVAEDLGGIPRGGLLARAPDRRADAAARLASWSQHGSREQLAANAHLVDGLLAPRERGAFAGRLAESAPGAPAVHVAKVAARWPYALARVARGPWER